MIHPFFPYRIFPLGDAAITVDYGNLIDESINKEVIARFNQLRQNPLTGMIEVVPAYSSFSVFYDLKILKNIIQSHKTVFDWMQRQLEDRLQQPVQTDQTGERLINIPVCYDDEFAVDIKHLASEKNISVAEVIQIHTSKKYRVYMLGFLPGFAYMGEVDDKILVPRKPQPVHVIEGSVGIAGKQTGIYPLASPGGWQIIGRTPLNLFEGENDELTLLRAGDTVQFYSIDKGEFEKIIATEPLKH